MTDVAKIRERLEYAQMRDEPTYALDVADVLHILDALDEAIEALALHRRPPARAELDTTPAQLSPPTNPNPVQPRPEWWGPQYAPGEHRVPRSTSRTVDLQPPQETP